MRMRCPACGAAASLDVLAAHEAASEAIALVFKLHGRLGGALMRYLALFRPAKNVLTMDRVASLLGDLIPDIQRGRITRKNREWPAPVDVWINAIEIVLQSPNLRRPLSSHGYLYEVICGQAEQVEARAEQQVEDTRRYPYSENRQDSVAPVAIAAVIDRPAPAPTPKTPMPAHVAEQIKSLGIAK